MSVQQKPDINIGALALISIGVLAITSQVFSFNIFSLLWPLSVLVPGLMMLRAARCEMFDSKGGDQAWLSIPAMMVTGTGALLFYQNAFDHWESWAYAWTLYGVFLGWGFLQVDSLLENDDAADLVPIGREMIRYSLYSFVAFALFFELLIFGGWVRQLAIAIVLIAVGLYLLNRQDDADPEATFALPFQFAGSGQQPRKPKRKNSAFGPAHAVVYGLGEVHPSGPAHVTPQAPPLDTQQADNDAEPQVV